MTNPITSTLDAGQQKIAGDALQGTVVDLIDLSLIAKQAHWNVIGKNFRSVHLALDELVTAARDFTDEAAERATAIGVSPDGRSETVSATAGTKGFGTGWTKDDEVTAAVVDNLAAVVDRLRGRIADTEAADPVTQDLLIAITARLEQLHWMWQAQV
ncbi:DNA starvation/stationary phase protection protein [Rhodococcus sp. BP-252]|jgi:starvation-inducible DNA-binding protein|uniref:DNA starvation/stationary phase protection protein n=1 Tax=Rhodococcoides kyotonense TaxID=398843 RepID=A0A177YFE5_9NOCA|nr:MULTISPECIES: DNA starvation/stationary phase protection protein [Rhodococcus]MBY6410861.1 DNA starvation/stationary phase protection protein [Rhodococcus sp. BP-320]MBY6415314.1 DNA starvation/stationary phase protection protein [Rhodococcus sp. BP-321]MBY6419929.1 DNA starvation/stationary phase protection protein [Rhodococcus sp. BP-324]MBY6425417.1 DNA starvation/stationary phase protection protein [Rhodococcus sp. BP-323]MBY6430520.1 DNA starvation/stationary phase protection protein [